MSFFHELANDDLNANFGSMDDLDEHIHSYSQHTCEDIRRSNKILVQLYLIYQLSSCAFDCIIHDNWLKCYIE